MIVSRLGLAALLSATNLFDRRIKQHVFGDILRRQITAELRFEWGSRSH